jgi:hypothetical protein
VAFGGQTIARLLAALRGFVPAAAAVLLVSAMLTRGANIAGATISLMGMVLGNLAGIPAGRFLLRHGIEESDRRLPLLLSLFFLPLALLPAQPGALGIYQLGQGGWLAIAAGLVAALPLGLAMGTGWPLQSLPARRRWTLVGVALGGLLALSAALTVTLFRSTFLIALVAAPLVWPTLPPQGQRSLLARMLLTLLVLHSSLFLLFI